MVVHILQILVCNDFGMLNSATARWKTCRGQGMGKGLRTSMYFPGLPFSPNLHVFLKDLQMGFPGGSDSKVSARTVGNLGSIPRSGRSPGEGNGNPLQYSCLENPMDWGAWWATVHGLAKSRIQLNDFTFSLLCVCVCVCVCVYICINFFVYLKHCKSTMFQFNTLEKKWLNSHLLFPIFEISYNI